MIALQAAFACASPTFHDGDNIRCAGGREMRLAGINAPELAGSPSCRRGARSRAWCNDRLGRRAQAALRAFAAGRAVRCRVVDASPRLSGFQSADPYGRPVVRCSAEGVGDLGEAMVRAGWARRW